MRGYWRGLRVLAERFGITDRKSGRLVGVSAQWIDGAMFNTRQET